MREDVSAHFGAVSLIDMHTGHNIVFFLFISYFSEITSSLSALRFPSPYLAMYNAPAPKTSSASPAGGH